MGDFVITLVKDGHEDLYREFCNSPDPSAASLKAADSGKAWGSFMVQADDEAQARMKALLENPGLTVYDVRKG